jgi:hypothetical protein
VTTKQFHAQAIEHGFAEYDSQTGHWQWATNQRSFLKPTTD